jgi:A/G-specific adenine glycosylase
MTKKETKKFQQAVLRWYHEYGRKDLPWQSVSSPYRVWVSEIMLQQTQVKTVIPYFKRWMKKFPTLGSLARSDLDEVLQIWAGLGYYARAKHLHQTATILVKQYHSVFPSDLDLLQTLPGIGHSTAGAILSFGLRKRACILDGNIKRLFSRYALIEGPTNRADVLKQLWSLSELLTPAQHFIPYNQALMDLGSFICVRKNPRCEECPLHCSCQARLQHRIDELPTQRAKKILPLKKVRFLLLQNERGDFLLEKRPAVGIWSNLWSFPVCVYDENWKEVCQKKYGLLVNDEKSLASFRHMFSHFCWEIFPLLVKVKTMINNVMERQTMIWYSLKDKLNKGIPQPIKFLLKLQRSVDLWNQKDQKS